jgi:N-acetylneuraminic acid mutarotase
LNKIIALFSALLVLASLLLFGCGVTNSSNNNNNSGGARAWSQLLSAGAFAARDGFPLLAFNGQLWIIGGHSYSYGTSGTDVYWNDVWSSSDGITWTMQTSSANFSPRTLHTGLVFDNKMWILGGSRDTSYDMLNEIWSSSDGITWTQVSANPVFSGRYHHRAAVMDNKMWVSGGTGWLNDVWYSSNGQSWTQAVTNASWPPRIGNGFISHENKLWVINGYFGDGETWSSPDGASWTIVPSGNSALPRGSHFFGCVVFDNKMWVVGGNRQDRWGFVTDSNTSYYSANGSNWTESSATPSFTARHRHGTAVLNNKLYVVGGGTTASGYLNDVWVLQ